jgi:ABC-type uncharacterized transport system substrate-binding protein
VDGDTVILIPRFAEGRESRLSALAQELVGRKVAVLVTAGEAAALAVKTATREIPAVMLTVSDPVGIGLVTSLARPGGNLTGLSDLHADLVSKRLDLLKQLTPALTRVAVLMNPTNPAHPLQLKIIETAARAAGVAILPIEIKEGDDINRAFAAAATDRPGGIMVLGDRFFGAESRRISEQIAKHRLPAIFTHRSWVEAGGLMSYGVSFPDQYQRAAAYVDKILRGAKPADLPIEQPTNFELVVNRKAARELDLTIPPALLARADAIVG